MKENAFLLMVQDIINGYRKDMPAVFMDSARKRHLQKLREELVLMKETYEALGMETVRPFSQVMKGLEQ